LKAAMFLRSIQTGVFKSIFEVLKDVLIDVSLCFTEEGCEILCLDDAQVAVVQVMLRASEFEDYECHKQTVVGVNATQMYRLLKSIGSSDVLEMRVTDDFTLEIRSTNPVKKSRSRFNLKILDINNEDVDLNGITESVARTTFSSLDLQKMCREYQHLSKVVNVLRDPGVIRFCIEGDFASQVTEFDIDDDSFVGEGFEDPFALRYLNLFMKASSMSPNVTLLHYGARMPLVLEFSASSLGFMRFYTAPRVAEAH